MFEKEAEKYVKAFTDRSHIWSNDKLMQLQLREAFKDGAEFGYNKANEWRYVKDELPPEDVPILCNRGGNIYVAWFILGKWKGDKYNDVKKPYAWKEIVLPELPKESE